jgi:hypothetical protein
MTMPASNLRIGADLGVGEFGDSLSNVRLGALSSSASVTTPYALKGKWGGYSLMQYYFGGISDLSAGDILNMYRPVSRLAHEAGTTITINANYHLYSNNSSDTVSIYARNNDTTWGGEIDSANGPGYHSSGSFSWEGITSSMTPRVRFNIYTVGSSGSYAEVYITSVTVTAGDSYDIGIIPINWTEIM